MIKKLIPIFAAFGLMCASCVEGNVPVTDGDGALSLVIEDPAVATKAGSDTGVRTWETAVSSLDVYLLSGGSVMRHEHFSSATPMQMPYQADVMGVQSGDYEVMVLGNAPAAAATATTKAALDAIAISLDNCPLGGAGFVMSGSAGTVSVVSGTTRTGSATLSRYCSRVRLKSVRNAAPYGSITVKGAFLENVPTSWTLAGVVNAASVGGWGNLAGRAGGYSASTSPADFIKGAGAVTPVQYASHLAKFQSVGIASGATESSSFGWDMYCFPTPNGAAANDQYGPIVASSAVTARPRLVVLATVNGTDYFYPVTLATASGETLARNTSYDVELTILDTGSSDPNEPVVNGSIYAVVTGPSSTWTAGNNYDEQL